MHARKCVPAPGRLLDEAKAAHRPFRRAQRLNSAPGMPSRLAALPIAERRGVEIMSAGPPTNFDGAVVEIPQRLTHLPDLADENVPTFPVFHRLLVERAVGPPVVGLILAGYLEPAPVS